jgi:hypothetical protein
MLSILSILALSILSILAGEVSGAKKRPETRIPLALRVKVYKVYREGKAEERTWVTGGCDGS